MLATPQLKVNDALRVVLASKLKGGHHMFDLFHAVSMSQIFPFFACPARGSN